LRIGENGEGHCHAVVVQITNSLSESGKILNVIDLVQKRLDGSETESVDPRVVGAGHIVVANQLLDGAVRPIITPRDVFQNAFQSSPSWFRGYCDITLPP